MRVVSVAAIEDEDAPPTVATRGASIGTRRLSDASCIANN